MITVDQAIPKDIAKTALIIPDGPIWAFSMLEEKVAHLSENFKTIGIGHNDRIAFVHPQDHAFVASFLALLRIGAACRALNPAYRSEEFKFYLEVIQPKAVLVPNAIPESIQEAAHMLHIPLLTIDPDLQLQAQGPIQQSTPTSPGPDDTALFLHTSGTTGRPKGVPLRHRNLLASMRNIATTLQLTAADTGLCIMPLFHIHGLMVSLLSPLSRGATVVLAPRFSASQFWRWVKDHQVNWFSAVPTIHQTLLNRAEEDDAPYPSPFRFIRSSSSPLAVPVLEAMESRFGCPVLEAYGMTEATHQIASNPLPPEERRPGTVGKGFGVKSPFCLRTMTFYQQGKREKLSFKATMLSIIMKTIPRQMPRVFFKAGFARVTLVS